MKNPSDALNNEITEIDELEHECEHDHEHKHNHDHDNKSAAKSSSRNILTAFWLNFIFIFIEVAGGLYTGSVAILSDAIHDFGDCLAILFAFVLEKKSAQKPDDKYTYGYRRLSILSALVTALVLVLGSAVVIRISIIRLLAPETIEIKSGAMVIISIFGVLINGLAVLRTRGSGGVNQRVISLHMLEDVLGWAVVLAGSICIKLFDMPIIDPILSILVGIYILYHAVRNISDALSVLLERVPADFDIAKYRSELSSIEEVDELHHVHVWTLDGQSLLATAHLVVSDDADARSMRSIKDSARRVSESFGISHLTVQIDTVSDGCCDDQCRLHEAAADSGHHHHHHHH